MSNACQDNMKLKRLEKIISESHIDNQGNVSTSTNNTSHRVFFLKLFSDSKSQNVKFLLIDVFYFFSKNLIQFPSFIFSIISNVK